MFALNSVEMWGRSLGLKVDIWKRPFIITHNMHDNMFELHGYSQGKSCIMHHNSLKPYPEVELPRWAASLQGEARGPTSSEAGARIEEGMWIGAHGGAMVQGAEKNSVNRTRLELGGLILPKVSQKVGPAQRNMLILLARLRSVNPPWIR